MRLESLLGRRGRPRASIQADLDHIDDDLEGVAGRADLRPRPRRQQRGGRAPASPTAAGRSASSPTTRAFPRCSSASGGCARRGASTSSRGATCARSTACSGGSEMLALLIDWGYRSDGIPVRLFGAWTTLPAGPATLAAKTGSRDPAGRDPADAPTARFHVAYSPVDHGRRRASPADLARATQADRRRARGDDRARRRSSGTASSRCGRRPPAEAAELEARAAAMLADDAARRTRRGRPVAGADAATPAEPIRAEPRAARVVTGAGTAEARPRRARHPRPASPRSRWSCAASWLACHLPGARRSSRSRTWSAGLVPPRARARGPGPAQPRAASPASSADDGLGRRPGARRRHATRARSSGSSGSAFRHDARYYLEILRAPGLDPGVSSTSGSSSRPRRTVDAAFAAAARSIFVVGPPRADRAARPVPRRSLRRGRSSRRWRRSTTRRCRPGSSGPAASLGVRIVGAARGAPRAPGRAEARRATSGSSATATSPAAGSRCRSSARRRRSRSGRRCSRSRPARRSPRVGVWRTGRRPYRGPARRGPGRGRGHAARADRGDAAPLEARPSSG